MLVGQDHGRHPGRITQAAQVGERAGPGIEQQGGVVGLDQVAAAGTTGPGPAAVAPEHRERSQWRRQFPCSSAAGYEWVEISSAAATSA